MTLESRFLQHLAIKHEKITHKIVEQINAIMIPLDTQGFFKSSKNDCREGNVTFLNFTGFCILGSEKFLALTDLKIKFLNSMPLLVMTVGGL